MKKYIFLTASAIAAMAGFTACDDDTDCGCDCNPPVIKRMEALDAPGVPLDHVEGGQYVAILGENLGDVVAVKFGDQSADLKPAFRSDNTLVFQVPVVSSSSTGRLITKSCQKGFEKQVLGVTVGAPTISMIYNEFPADGEYLKLRGKNYVGTALQVQFNAGTADSINVDVVETDIQSQTELWVKVPAGTKERSQVKIINTAEGKDGYAPGLLRDTRNILVDFENNLTGVMSTGSIAKASDGSYSVDNDDSKFSADRKSLIEKEGNLNYTSKKGAKNQYGVFYDTNWQAVLFAQNWDESQEELSMLEHSVFGPFLKDVQTNPASLANYVVKFEVNVPKEHPTNQLVVTLGFTNQYETGLGASRQYAAVLQASPISWNMSGGDEGWKISSAADFTTDGWMTVAVPFDEFKWNLEARNYITSAQNLTSGSLVESDYAMFGDEVNQLPYYAYKTNGTTALTDEDKLGDIWGGLTIQVNPYDGSANSDNDAKMIFAIDNIRIVPNDGNGAVYPKLKWGTPSQHFYDNPK